MQGRDYIFCLQDKNFNFWKVENGVVSRSAQPYFLSFAPDGWSDISIQNVRNKKYWGIDRTVTIPLKYVNDGAQILKYIFYTLGIEESVYLVIASQKLDYTPGVSYGYWYKRIFRGEVDLSTFAHNGSKITATTLEDGLAKYLKANEGTVFEFPMNVPEAVTIKMDGINLHNNLHYSDISQLPISASMYGRNFFGPAVYISEEGDMTGILSQSETLEKVSNMFADRMASLNVILTNADTKPVSVRIVGTLEIKVTAVWFSDSGIRFGFITSKTDELNEYSNLILSLPHLDVPDIGKTFTQEFDIPITLLPGESLFRGGQFNQQSDTETVFEFTDNSRYDIKLITRHDPTYIKAFRPQYLFEQLLSKVTEGNFTAAISNFFTKYKNVVLTSGNAIRGLEDATLKIKWTDFFKWWDSFSSVGLNEKLKVVDLDEKENLIDAVNTIKLPEPASDSFKVSVAKDLLFNELQIGYPEIKNDVGVLNGNEETNTKMIFSLGTTKSPAVLDKISPVKASPYEIEKIRVTTLSKDTTDYKADNDTFALEIEDQLQPATDTIPAHYKLDRSLNPGATGVLEPATIFNIGLSPKRNFDRNGSTIHSFLYLSDNKTLKFISADKNDKMIANGLVEKADVNIGSLAAKFLDPVLFDFDIEAPEDLEDMLDINPLQLFEFPFQGDTYFGLLEKVSVAPSSNAAQSYQLLSHAKNDLTKLIQYYGQ